MCKGKLKPLTLIDPGLYTIIFYLYGNKINGIVGSIGSLSLHFKFCMQRFTNTASRSLVYKERKENANIYLVIEIFKQGYFQRHSDKSPGQGRVSGHDQRLDEGGPQHHEEQQRQDPGREQETEGRDGETEKTGEQENLRSECCQQSCHIRYIKPSGSEGGKKSFICSGKN